MGLTLYFGVHSLASQRLFLISKDRSVRDAGRSNVANVRTGIEKLKASSLLKYETSNGKDSGTLIRKEVAFAIADNNGGSIMERRYWIEQSDLSGGRRTELVSSDETHDVRIKTLWWNSYNSLYEIIDQPNLVIVANKFLIPKEFLPEQNQLSLAYRSPKGRYANVVFVPYSPDIHSRDLVDAGRTYINESIDGAFTDLQKRGVRSLDRPEMLVVNVTSVDLIRTILLVEHIDYFSFAFADDDGLTLAQRVLVLVGANQEWAYRYTNSPAGANGLAQFIASTYEIIRKAYPSAGLIRDYKLGMADHVNAVKAMVLFLDYHRKILRQGIGSSVAARMGISDQMLAATYNGGANGVISAVASSGTGWTVSERLALETRRYLEKYDKIKSLNLF